MLSSECVCCGYLTLDGQEKYEICPVCFWTADPKVKSLDDVSVENRWMTLRKAKENFQHFGAHAEDMILHARDPKIEEYPEYYKK